jgi:hypothetical protein
MRAIGAEPGKGAAAPPDDLVLHKSARECYMTEPHRRDICGLVRARRAAQEEADKERVTSRE